MRSATSVRHVSRSLPAPAQYLCGLTWDGTHLWHSDQGAKTIYAIDRTDGTVLRELRCPYVRADLAFDGSVLCQVGGRPKRIVLVDRTSGEVVGNREVLPASGRLTGIELGPEGMWMCLRRPMVVQSRSRLPHGAVGGRSRWLRRRLIRKCPGVWVRQRGRG